MSQQARTSNARAACASLKERSSADREARALSQQARTSNARAACASKVAERKTEVIRAESAEAMVRAEAAEIAKVESAIRTEVAEKEAGELRALSWGPSARGARGSNPTPER